jgi:hypothetical protein
MGKPQSKAPSPSFRAASRLCRRPSAAIPWDRDLPESTRRQHLAAPCWISSWYRLFLPLFLPTPSSLMLILTVNFHELYFICLRQLVGHVNTNRKIHGILIVWTILFWTIYMDHASYGYCIKQGISALTNTLCLFFE